MWTLTRSREFSDLTNQITLESLHSLPYKRYLPSVTPSLTFLERERAFLVWFQLLSTKIHISEWLEMLRKSLSMPNQQASTAHFSRHFKVKKQKCLQVTQQVVYYWLTPKMTLKRRSTSMLLAVDRILWSCKEKRALILTLTSHINIYNFSWRMMKNLKKSDRSIVQDKCWPPKSKLSLLKFFKSLSQNFKQRESW